MTNANMPSYVDFDLAATITSGGTTSGAVDLGGGTLAGLEIPSTFDGTAVTFQRASTLGGTYYTVQDGAGADYTLTVAASRYVPISNLALFAGVRFLKVVAAATQTTTDTVIPVVTAPLLQF